MEETTNGDDGTVIVEKANGSVSNDEGFRNNEGAAIKSTCETENVIIVHENLHSRTSAEESFINNQINVETETNLAIEMLDTVLEAEDESDSIESEINSRRESTQSINCKDSNVHPTMLTPELSQEKSPENVPTETINHELIDYEYVRQEIEAEIDEILKHAQVSAEIELNKSQSEDESDENVFKNRKFLIHLNDLISTKSNQKALNVQSKMPEDKSETLPILKHSKSAPDFKFIMDSVDIEEKSFNDDTSVEYILSDDEGVESIPPPPIFSAELFERVATLKRTQKVEENHLEKLEKPIQIEDETPEEESVDKENFRDKLEKLLRVPPSRLSLIAPVPLPRTSLIKIKDDNQASPREVLTTTAPISSSMQKQRELFDEVLRKIKKENDEKVSSVEQI